MTEKRSNARGRSAGTGPRLWKNFIFAPLGQGIARVPDMIKALQENAYNGWLVVEQDTTPVDPTENARENRLYLERLLEELKAGG